jgi:hypothetical protein
VQSWAKEGRGEKDPKRLEVHGKRFQMMRTRVKAPVASNAIADPCASFCPNCPFTPSTLVCKLSRRKIEGLICVILQSKPGEGGHICIKDFSTTAKSIDCLPVYFQTYVKIKQAEHYINW